MRDGPLCIIHVAAPADDKAVATLYRTTPLLSASGIRQVVLAIDDKPEGNVSFPAGTSALGAEVRSLRIARLSLLGKIRALQAQFQEFVHEGSLYAVHLHGMGACLLGSRALMASATRARVVCSTLGVGRSSGWASALLGRLLQNQLAAMNYAVLAASQPEAEALSRLLNRSADLLPYPVGDVFFEVARSEEMPPIVIADGPGMHAVKIVTRLCVLLNGRATRVRFSWLGVPDGHARAALDAANVEILAALDDGEKARHLSRASAVLHLSMADGLPLGVAEAMAAGVPCLASDTPPHRAVIRHGDTGLICTSQRDFLERLVGLLRDRNERRRLGEAARAEAGRSFTLRQCQNALLRAYGLPTFNLRAAADAASRAA